MVNKIVVPKAIKHFDSAPNLPESYKSDLITNLIKNGKRINLASFINTSTKIYTVPSGYSFFLTSIAISLTATAATTAGGSIRAPSDTNTYELIHQKSNNIINSSFAYSINYPIPLIFPEKSSFVLISGSTDLSVEGMIAGYEIINSLI